jgi:hypothetical protein
MKSGCFALCFASYTSRIFVAMLGLPGMKERKRIPWVAPSISPKTSSRSDGVVGLSFDRLFCFVFGENQAARSPRRRGA